MNILPRRRLTLRLSVTTLALGAAAAGCFTQPDAGNSQAGTTSLTETSLTKLDTATASYAEPDGVMGVTSSHVTFDGDDVTILGSDLGATQLAIPDAEGPVSVGDVDGDGGEDFLVWLHPQSVDGTMSVFSAAGAELAATPASTLFDFSAPSFFGAGPDAIVLGDGEQSRVYAPDDLTFERPLTTIASWEYTHISEADVTGDGVDDHVLTSNLYPDDYGSGKVWVMDGTDRGTTNVESDAFASLLGDTTQTIGKIQGMLPPVDMNGDGHLDLVVEDLGLSAYDVSTGGVIDVVDAFTSVDGVGSGRLLDFDGDGLPDLAGSVLRNGEPEPGFGVVFALSTGVTDFAAAVNWQVVEGDGVLAVVDLNADGFDDAVYATDGELYMFAGGSDRSSE